MSTRVGQHRSWLLAGLVEGLMPGWPCVAMHTTGACASRSRRRRRCPAPPAGRSSRPERTALSGARLTAQNLAAAPTLTRHQGSRSATHAARWRGPD